MKGIFTDKKILAIFGILLLLGGIIVFILSLNKSKAKPVSSKGVLALNTDKFNYRPGEKMIISIASLDESGLTLCKSNLKLELVDSQDKTTNINITPSPTCNGGSVTNDPDYVASQTLEKTGDYKLKLTNLDTKMVIETKIKVSQNLSFDVKRSGATRLNVSKPNRYPMIITVKTDRDFQGQIKDQIPDGIKVVWQGPAKIEKTNIIWDVDIKAGEENTFSYEYEAGQNTLGVYQFGPINIAGQNIESLWQAVSAK